MVFWKRVKKIGCRCFKGTPQNPGRQVKLSKCAGKRKPTGCVKGRRKAATKALRPYVRRGGRVMPAFSPFAPIMATRDELTIGNAAKTTMKLCGCKPNVMRTKRGERKVVACSVANPATGKVLGHVPRFVNAHDYAAAKAAKRVCVYVPKFAVQAILNKGMLD